MDNTQILTIGLTISVSFLAVLAGVLLNSSRLTDLRAYTDGRFNATDQRFNDLRDALRAEIRASQAETRQAIAELKALIEKNHSEMLVRLAEIDQRLTRLEGERRVVQ